MSSAVMDMFLSLYTSLTAVTILSEMLLNSDSALPEKSDANAVAEILSFLLVIFLKQFFHSNEFPVFQLIHLPAQYTKNIVHQHWAKGLKYTNNL